MDIPGQTLDAGTYAFRMVFTSSKGTCESLTTIVVENEYKPTGVIIPLLSKDQETFVSNLPVVFKTEVKTKYPLTVTYQWTVTDHPELSSTMKYFKIEPEQLPEGTYQVNLSLADQENANFSQKAFQIIGPPHSGALVVSPSSGVAIEDDFTLTAIGWQDEEENLPLRYDFLQDGKILVGDPFEPSLTTKLDG